MLFIITRFSNVIGHHISTASDMFCIKYVRTCIMTCVYLIINFNSNFIVTPKNLAQNIVILYYIHYGYNIEHH